MQTDTLKVGDKVTVAKSRERRKVKLAGEVREVKSTTHALIFWPDINDSISTRINTLRKVQS